MQGPGDRVRQTSRRKFTFTHLQTQLTTQKQSDGDPGAVLQGHFRTVHCNLPSQHSQTSMPLAIVWFFLMARRIASVPKTFFPFILSLSQTKLFFKSSVGWSLWLLNLFLLSSDYYDLNMEHQRNLSSQPQAVTGTNTAVLETRQKVPRGEDGRASRE